ncbi:chorismate mutase [Buchnera aphidicola]|uniref:chorismate mutase n=1 Tax=Buchnera aphidicola TaxID=9 RepID=UPI0034645606
MKITKKMLILRKKINKINKSIIILLNKRNLISEKIIKEKININYPIKDTKREKKIFEKIINYSKKYNLKKKYLIKIFKIIIKNSRKIQKKIEKKKK